MANQTCREPLAVTGLESLELRRLRCHLICSLHAVKILTNPLLPHHAIATGLAGLIDIDIDGLYIAACMPGRKTTND